jgi:hypothetical protein
MPIQVLLAERASVTIEDSQRITPPFLAKNEALALKYLLDLKTWTPTDLVLLCHDHNCVREQLTLLLAGNAASLPFSICEDPLPRSFLHR